MHPVSFIVKITSKVKIQTQGMPTHPHSHNECQAANGLAPHEARASEAMQMIISEYSVFNYIIMGSIDNTFKHAARRTLIINFTCV